MRFYSFLLLSMLVLSAHSTTVIAQGALSGKIAGSDVRHKLYGDFKVDESKAGSNQAGTFQIILYNLNGQPFGRQSISPNGRYDFPNVINGEYNLIVEMDGTEVARIPIVLQQQYATDIRKDIMLEWRSGTGAAAVKSTVISVGALYARNSTRQSLFDKSQEAIKKNDLKQAATLLNQIVSTDSKDFPAWAELGLVYFKLEKMVEAEKALRSALSENNEFFLALLNLGKVLYVQKHLDGAIEALTKALEINSKSADAHYFLGETYLAAKKGSKAVGHLNEALKLDPMGKADAHLRLGTLYSAAGMKDKAIAEFEQYLVKRPDSPDKKRIQQYISENK